MRILYFSFDYSSHDHRFLSAIVKGGHEAFYLKLQDNLRQTEDRPVPGGVEQIHWAGGQRLFRWVDIPRLVIDFRRVAGRIQPDLIHAGPVQTCAFIVSLSGVQPLLTMSWGFDLMQDAQRNLWMEMITKYVMRKTTYFTSDAGVTREKAISYGMDPERTSIIPWGVDLDEFKPGRRSLNVNGSFTILCNRAWEPRYGVDILAAAYMLAARQDERLNLVLLGGGSQNQEIREILDRGGVLDRVHLVGQVPQRDLPDWYNNSDLYISPSHVDGSSVSLMEALACGMPVLVSDIPGNKEWIEDGINGWLFPDGNVNVLAEKIMQIISSKDSFVNIARSARLTAQARADWSKNQKLLMNTYDLTAKLGAGHNGVRFSN